MGVYQYHVVGIITYQRMISFWENLFVIFLATASLATLVKTWDLAVRDKIRVETDSHVAKTAKFCKACLCGIQGKDHHCVWIGVCISKSNLKW